MDKCHKCGADTLLYDDGLPICLKCVGKGQYSAQGARSRAAGDAEEARGSVGLMRDVRPEEKYKLRSEILGIVLEANPRTTVTIPGNAIVTILAEPVDGKRMVDVDWNGKTVMIFARDLRERADRVTRQPR